MPRFCGICQLRHLWMSRIARDGHALPCLRPCRAVAFAENALQQDGLRAFRSEVTEISRRTQRKAAFSVSSASQTLWPL